MQQPLPPPFFFLHCHTVWFCILLRQAFPQEMLTFQLDLPYVLGCGGQCDRLDLAIPQVHVSLSDVFLWMNRVRKIPVFLRDEHFCKISCWNIRYKTLEKSHLDTACKTSPWNRGMEGLMEVIRGAVFHDRRLENLSCTVKHRLKEERIAVCKVSKK